MVLERLNQLWITDLTYVVIPGGFVYLAAILDAFSRKVVGYAISRSMEARIAMAALIDPGSEWRLHRQWFEQSAMGDLLGEDFDLAQKDNLYRCLDKLLTHKTAFFSFLQ